MKIIVKYNGGPFHNEEYSYDFKKNISESKIQEEIKKLTTRLFQHRYNRNPEIDFSADYYYKLDKINSTKMIRIYIFDDHKIA